MTPHARYYSLHGLIAAETAKRGLRTDQVVELVRRAEVVLAGVSIAHQSEHRGIPTPHGGDVIRPAMERGELNVHELSSKGHYSKQLRGFWGPYLGSESTLGLVQWSDDGPRPGENLDETAVRAGLGEILELLQRDTIPVTELSGMSHLCICQATNAADGLMLRDSLLPPTNTIHSMFAEDRRSQTIRLLLRLLELAQDEDLSFADMPGFLTFDPRVHHDPLVSGLEAYPAWRGLALRARSVEAWRNLWAWLVSKIGGFMSISELGDALADELSDQTVGAFQDGLPSTRDSDSLLPAELDRSILDANVPIQCLSILALGARRSGDLPAKVASYFEHPTNEHFQQLTPSWFQHQLHDWSDRSVRDFGVFLVEQLVARSQRVALSKATFDRTIGIHRIPTRVFVRDGFVRRDSNEGGGGVALRWNQAMTVLSGIGLVEYDDKMWRVTEAGRNV